MSRDVKLSRLARVYLPGKAIGPDDKQIQYINIFKYFYFNVGNIFKIKLRTIFMNNGNILLLSIYYLNYFIKKKP